MKQQVYFLVMNEDGTILCAPAKYLQDFWRDSFDLYLPQTQRSRYKAQAHYFDRKPAELWVERFRARELELNAAFHQLENLLNDRYFYRIFDTWDDELFFFYAMLLQHILLLLMQFEAKQMVPGELSALWKWLFYDAQDRWVILLQTAHVIPVEARGKLPVWELPGPTPARLT